MERQPRAAKGKRRVVRAATHALPVSGPCMIRFHDSERLKPLCVGVGVWAYPQRNGCEPQDVRLAPTEQAPPVRGPHSPARQASKRHAKYTPRRRVLSRNRPVLPNSPKKEGISGSTAVPLVSKNSLPPIRGGANRTSRWSDSHRLHMQRQQPHQAHARPHERNTREAEGQELRAITRPM